MAKKKILIVDDEADIIEVMKVRLERQDYKVVTASDGEEALEKVSHEKPDLIILDLILPKIDGYEVYRRLKSDKEYRRIPVILTTARIQELDQELGREVSADAYLRKPIDQQILLKKIQELL